MKKTLFRSTSFAALAIAPFITGCATKKFVRTSVAPINQKVGELDTASKAQGESIAELERGVARADERAMGADARAEAAGKEAALARKEAAEGKTFAETGLSRVSGEMKTMEGGINTRFENMRDFKLINTDNVLFRSGRAELSDEAMQSLDASVGKVQGMKNFVVELQGFTDSTGSKAANLDLSRRRADAVVRYLTSKHNVPLHRIFVAGYGQDNEVADNKTRDGRKQNRRVEMKVYLSGDEAAQSKMTPSATTPATPSTN